MEKILGPIIKSDDLVEREMEAMFGDKHEKLSQNQKDIERLTAEMHLLQKPDILDDIEFYDPEKLAKARKI